MGRKFGGGHIFVKTPAGTVRVFFQAIFWLARTIPPEWSRPRRFPIWPLLCALIFYAPARPVATPKNPGPEPGHSGENWKKTLAFTPDLAARPDKATRYLSGQIHFNHLLATARAHYERRFGPPPGSRPPSGRLEMRALAPEQLEPILRRELSHHRILGIMPDSFIDWQLRMLTPMVLGKYSFLTGEVLVFPRNIRRLARHQGGLFRQRGFLAVILLHEICHGLDNQYFAFPETISQINRFGTYQAMNSLVEGHASFMTRQIAPALGLNRWVDDFEKIQTTGRVAVPPEEKPEINLKNSRETPDTAQKSGSESLMQKQVRYLYVDSQKLFHHQARYFSRPADQTYFLFQNPPDSLAPLSPNALFSGPENAPVPGPGSKALRRISTACRGLPVPGGGLVYFPGKSYLYSGEDFQARLDQHRFSHFGKGSREYYWQKFGSAPVGGDLLPALAARVGAGPAKESLRAGRWTVRELTAREAQNSLLVRPSPAGACFFPSTPKQFRRPVMASRPDQMVRRWIRGEKSLVFIVDFALPEGRAVGEPVSLVSQWERAHQIYRQSRAAVRGQRKREKARSLLEQIFPGLTGGRQ